MNKLYMLCGAWILILVIALGVAGPAMVSAKNTLAVIAGIGVVAAAVWGLIRLGMIIYKEINNANS